MTLPAKSRCISTSLDSKLVVLLGAALLLNTGLAALHQSSIPAHGMLWPDTLAYAGNTERVSPFMYWIFEAFRKLSATDALPFGRFLWLNYGLLILALASVGAVGAVGLFSRLSHQLGFILVIAWIGYGHSYHLLFVQSLLTDSISTSAPVLLLVLIVLLYRFDISSLSGRLTVAALFLLSLFLFGIRAGNLYLVVWGTCFAVICSVTLHRTSQNTRRNTSAPNVTLVSGMTPAFALIAGFLAAQLLTSFAKPEAKPLYGTTFLPNIAHLSEGLASNDPCIATIFTTAKYTSADRERAARSGRGELLAYNVTNINEFHREVERLAADQGGEPIKDYLTCAAEATRLILYSRPLQVASTGLEQYLAVLISRPTLFDKRYDQELLERWYAAPVEPRVLMNASRWEVEYAVRSLPITGQVHPRDTILTNWSWRLPSLHLGTIHLVYLLQLAAITVAVGSIWRRKFDWLDAGVIGVVTMIHSSLLFYAVVSGFIERYQLPPDYWSFIFTVPLMFYVAQKGPQLLAFNASSRPTATRLKG